MKVSVEKPGTPAELVHHGIKGMKWGVRKDRTSGGGGSKGRSRAGRAVRALGRGASNVVFEIGANQQATHNEIVSKAADSWIKNDLPRIKAKYPTGSKLRNRLRHPLSPEAKGYRNDVKQAYLKRLEESANSMTNLQGTRRYTLKENGKPNTSQYHWRVHTEAIAHSAVVGDFVVQPIFDEEGFIIDIRDVAQDMQQSVMGEDFVLEHLGR